MPRKITAAHDPRVARLVAEVWARLTPPQQAKLGAYPVTLWAYSAAELAAMGKPHTAACAGADGQVWICLERLPADDLAAKAILAHELGHLLLRHPLLYGMQEGFDLETCEAAADGVVVAVLGREALERRRRVFGK